jgi:hypothetical protein
VNLSRGGEDGSEFNIQGVTNFTIEKGTTKTRTRMSFFGLIERDVKYRILNVTETFIKYENNEPTDSKTIRRYEREEIIE